MKLIASLFMLLLFLQVAAVVSILAHWFGFWSIFVVGVIVVTPLRILVWAALPLIVTVLTFFGVVQVWHWPWYVAIFVACPSLGLFMPVFFYGMLGKEKV